MIEKVIKKKMLTFLFGGKAMITRLRVGLIKKIHYINKLTRQLYQKQNIS